MIAYVPIALLLLLAAAGAGLAANAGEPAALWALCLSAPPGPSPETLWTQWSLAPETLIPLLGFAVAYSAGWQRAWAARRDASALLRKAAFTLAGLGLLTVALVSPLCRLSAALAFSHMIQHLIIVALAPPLILLGAPAQMLRLAWRSADRGAPRRGLKRAPRHVAPALAYGFGIWFWHIPAAYQAALTGYWPHLAMLLSLLAASFWFWRTVITAPAAAFGPVALILFATLVHTGMLGALLTFSPHVWYPLMASGAAQWGLLPIEDQQLAGLIMWVSMGGVYLAAALVVIGIGLEAHSRMSLSLRSGLRS